MRKRRGGKKIIFWGEKKGYINPGYKYRRFEYDTDNATLEYYSENLGSSEENLESSKKKGSINIKNVSLLTSEQLRNWQSTSDIVPTKISILDENGRTFFLRQKNCDEKWNNVAEFLKSFQNKEYISRFKAYFSTVNSEKYMLTPDWYEYDIVNKTLSRLLNIGEEYDGSPSPPYIPEYTIKDIYNFHTLRQSKSDEELWYSFHTLKKKYFLKVINSASYSKYDAESVLKKWLQEKVTSQPQKWDIINHILYNDTMYQDNKKKKEELIENMPQNKMKKILDIMKIITEARSVQYNYCDAGKNAWARFWEEWFGRAKQLDSTSSSYIPFPNIPFPNYPVYDPPLWRLRSLALPDSLLESFLKDLELLENGSLR